ncbi:MAG: molybdopterin-dependent oxidoreductase [Hyphomicrobiales bacterium]|nr:molybdopterin-dependent oxidoreductase [Hyphomicrobiales bacterium]
MQMAWTDAAKTKVVKTACGMCYIGCGVDVSVKNGVVIGVEGSVNNPQNRGKMCAKGKAGFMNLYNPHRVKAPLKRTNPNKGIDVDPGWQEISWAEAVDTIVANLQRIRNEPKKLWVQAWDVMGDGMFWLSSFGSAFGSCHVNVASSPTCGKVVHPVEFFSGGGFHQQPDLHYAKYCMLVGTQFGIAARSAMNHHMLDMAEARERGMKLVVVDPVGGHAASKATEWIPIRPGTDGAMALSMLQVLLNELEIYDEKFLKNKTNAPYLVGADGKYLRDPKTREPLVHDAADGKVKAHNDPSLKDPSIIGTYQSEGRTGRTAFDLLREHVKKYSPEATEEITTIPAATVRRMAKEFGEAACVGQTIVLDGVEVPYRPACVDWARGTQGHKHGFHNCYVLRMLNIVVGSVNVPGGILSTGAAGKFPHLWWPEGGIDGMLEHGGQIMPIAHPKAFPGKTPTRPVRMDAGELFPLASHFHTLLPVTNENPEAFGLTDKDRIEVLLHAPVNSILGAFGDIKKVEKLYQSMRFIAGFAIEINENNLFDDVILPFPSYLERYDFMAGMGAYMIAPCGQDDFYWHVRQPVVELPPGMRQPQEVLQEIAQRLGLLDDMFRLINHTYMMNQAYELRPGTRYAMPEVIDRMTKSWFGEERGFDWFRENGVIRHPRGVDEAYIGPFVEARIPIYLEHFLARGEELKGVVDELGLPWDFSDYTPLYNWMPCPSHTALRKGEYDLIAVHFKLSYSYGAYGNENPWIDELCQRTNAYDILVNEAVGKAKGLRDGDEVWLESPVAKVKATIKLTQCIHPEVVGVAGHFGHWAPGMPVAKGKGVNFNSLLPTDLDHIDMISTALDHCVPVKIYKSRAGLQ